MKGSPAICSEKRVQRAQSTHRSRSSRTWAEMLIGLGKVRLMPPRSANRLSPRPLLIAWFWRGHSPPLSQTGQSSGWLMSRNSMMPCCALSATSVVAEARDLHPDLLGGADDQRVLGDADLDAVDGQGDQAGVDLLRRLVGGCHAEAPTGAKAVEAAGSNGQPPWVRCARYSSRKCWIELEMGLVAPSPRAQNERPRMLSHWSSSRSRSPSSPWPFSRRAIVCVSHHVPSRHGVHLPQDSCL